MKSKVKELIKRNEDKIIHLESQMEICIKLNYNAQLEHLKSKKRMIEISIVDLESLLQ